MIKNYDYLCVYGNYLTFFKFNLNNSPYNIKICLFFEFSLMLILSKYFKLNNIMKKITFLSLLILLGSYSISAQLVEDFEPGATTPDGLFGLDNEIVANSNTTGINTSANCLQMTRNNGNWYALSRVNIADQTIAASDKKFLTLMVRSSAVTNFAVRFDADSDTGNGSNAGIIQSLNAYDANNLNEWQQLVYEIRSTATGNHTFTSNGGTLFNLIIHPDSGNASNTGVVLDTSTPIFIDQLTITDTNPLASITNVVENFEGTVDATGQFGMSNSVVANPNQTGINTSANCLSITRSNTNWYALSRVNIEDQTITLGARKFLSIMVRSSVATTFAVRFDADSDTSIGSNPGIIRSLNSYDDNNLNEWQELIFEVRSTATGEPVFSSGTLYNIILHPDLGNGTNDSNDLDTSTPIFVDNLTLLFANPLENNWLGNTSTDWATGSNWSKGSVPTATEIVTIPNGTTFAPTINTTTGANPGSLTIETGAVVTVEDGGSLIVTGAVNGAQGSILYKRTLTADADPTKAWHLVTSPIAGVSIVNFIADNTLASGTTNTNFRGIGNYTNDGNGFNYYEVDYAGTDAFNVAKGFAIKNATSGTVEFSGFFRKSDREISISQGTDNFNLVGNAFLAYMNLGTFFTNNNAVDRLSESTIWLWDPSANAGNGGYITKMSGTDAAFEVAPGQAFFVSAGAAASNVISFSEANQSHKTDTFLKNANSRTEIELKISQDNLINTTKLYYIEGTSTDFDNGFDGSLFDGISSDLSIYSGLINEDKKLSVQSLPNSNFDEMIVPIGLKAASGKEITISANSLNLPNGINVFLEDRLNNTFTNLNDENFKVTLNENLDSTGRFFLRTSSQVLSTSSLALAGVQVFKMNNSILSIRGLQEGSKTGITIFNTLGKQVLSSSFTSTNNLDIALPKLASGIYIVNIKTDNGSLNKKIILE